MPRRRPVLAPCALLVLAAILAGACARTPGGTAPPNSIEVLTESIRQSPRDPQLRIALARAELAQGAATAAEGSLRRALSLAPRRTTWRPRSPRACWPSASTTKRSVVIGDPAARRESLRLPLTLLGAETRLRMTDTDPRVTLRQFVDAWRLRAGIDERSLPSDELRALDARLAALDTLNMLGEIDNLPDQLGYGYQLGLKHQLPDWKDFTRVVIAGMGGSAIGADLLASYSASLSPIPVSVHRDYGLPLYARGAVTLVICSSHSGNTEETLDAFESARKAGCRIITVCHDGELLKRAVDNNAPAWTFDHAGQAGSAIGFSFGLVLALFQRLGFIPDQKTAVEDAIASMKKSQEHLKADVPAANNPAKRYAGQLMGRWVTGSAPRWSPRLKGSWTRWLHSADIDSTSVTG